MDGDDDETGEDDKKMLNREAMMHNMSAIDGCRSYTTIFAGVATGILGATSVRGGLCFMASYVAISLALLAVMRGDSSNYTDEAIPNHIFGGVGRYALSFVLFWTLSYALVYIY
jgi:hypothetical protein